MRRILFGFGLISVLFILLILSLWLLGLRQDLRSSLEEPAYPRKSLVTTSLPLPDTASTTETQNPGSFSLESFVSPDHSCRPWLSWYWPQGKLERLKLTEQLVWIKDKGFGGVEIYPLPSSADENSFQLPLLAYLEHVLRLSTRMEMQVDMLGGAQGMALPPDANDSLRLKHLLYGESHVLGGKEIRIELPEARIPAHYYLNGWMEREDKRTHPFIRGGISRSKLVRIYGIKPKKELRTAYFWDLQDQTELDVDSIFVLDKNVTEEGELVWKAPAGYWKIVAIYEAPNGQYSYLPFQRTAGPLADPFDSVALRQHVNALYQQLSHLSEDALQSLHGISYGPFNYQAESFYFYGMEESFKNEKNFELGAWLPILIQSGNNNYLFDYFRITSKPEYILSEDDKRVRQTYQDFVSQQFLQTSVSGLGRDWKKLGLRVSTQPFGWDFDVISAAAKADIPVFDQYTTASSSLLQKLVSSGAVLGGRPLLRAKALGYRSKRDRVSSQEIRLAVDRCLMNGANQIVMDGANFEDEGNKGAYLPEHFRQTYPIEKDPVLEGFWKDLNAYLSRMQALMRMGKPGIDIAIYYPFKGFPRGMMFEKDHEEPFFNGEVREIAGELSFDPLQNNLSELFSREDDPRSAWLKALAPLVRELDQQGLNWIWVNDEFLQEASSDGSSIQMGATQVDFLLLPDVMSMEVETAENMASLARLGAKIIAYGDLPQKQESFPNAREKDERVRQAMESIVFRSPLLDPKELRNLIEGIFIPQRISFDDTYPFLRRHRRQLSEGGELNVFQNIGFKERVFQLESRDAELFHYWLNPHSGDVFKAEIRAGNNLQSYIVGYGTKVLLSLTEPLADSSFQSLPSIFSNPFEYNYMGKILLEKWDMAVGSNRKSPVFIDYRDTLLMDWWKLKGLKRLPMELHYSSSFEIGRKGNEQYLLDLGWINGTAEVFVNTQLVKKMFYKPYSLDISPYVEEGLNIVEIWVRRSEVKNPRMEKKEGQQPPIGLMGPTLIHVLKSDSEQQ